MDIWPLLITHCAQLTLSFYFTHVPALSCSNVLLFFVLKSNRHHLIVPCLKYSRFFFLLVQQPHCSTAMQFDFAHFGLAAAESNTICCLIGAHSCLPRCLAGSVLHVYTTSDLWPHTLTVWGQQAEHMLEWSLEIFYGNLLASRTGPKSLCWRQCCHFTNDEMFEVEHLKCFAYSNNVQITKTNQNVLVITWSEWKCEDSSSRRSLMITPLVWL